MNENERQALVIALVLCALLSVLLAEAYTRIQRLERRLDQRPARLRGPELWQLEDAHTGARWRAPRPAPAPECAPFDLVEVLDLDGQRIAAFVNQAVAGVRG